LRAPQCARFRCSYIIDNKFADKNHQYQTNTDYKAQLIAKKAAYKHDHGQDFQYRLNDPPGKIYQKYYCNTENSN
jgi:hypothetical protein